MTWPADPRSPPAAGAAPRLPPIQDLVLDEDMVDRLFTDLGLGAQILGVTVKGGAVARASGESPGSELGRLRGLLTTGQVYGLQVRYLHHGQEWWDTLMRVAGGIRLVRVRRADLG